MSVFGSISLWLAVGVAYVLWVEWRIRSLYAGGRAELEAKTHGWREPWANIELMRLQMWALIATTWPYWMAREIPHLVRTLPYRLACRIARRPNEPARQHPPKTRHRLNRD